MDEAHTNTTRILLVDLKLLYQISSRSREEERASCAAPRSFLLVRPPCFISCSPEDEVLVRESLGDTMPTTLHFLMFIPNVEALCDDEQRRNWLPRCRSMEVRMSVSQGG